MKQGVGFFFLSLSVFIFFPFISRQNLVLNVSIVGLLLHKINQKTNIVKDRSKLSNVNM